MKQIRPLAICIFRKDDKILVAEEFDPIKEEIFYRPLGGGIEFGERSEDTICRELMEEINVGVKKDSLKYLGAFENIFTFNGVQGHEIVLIYDGELKDPELYDQPMIVSDDPFGTRIRAVWKSVDEFGEGKSILYPEGLLKHLMK